MDGSGNIYVADYNNNAVKMMTPGGASITCVTTLGGGFTLPNGVALDASGNIYVSDLGSKTVKEMPSGCASSGCVTTLVGGFFYPEGVAVDGSGNIYVSDNGKGVKEVPSGCTSSNCILLLASEGNGPSGITTDKNGNVYAADDNTNAVGEIELHGVNLGTVAVGTTGPAMTLYFAFTASGSGISASALTQGAKGLDFADAGTGTCDTNGTSYAYNAANTCTVNVTFAPKYAGTRKGAAELLNGSGGVNATAYLYGVGQGPQLAFGAPATQTTLGGGFVYPGGVAVDGSGNVYVADTGRCGVGDTSRLCLGQLRNDAGRRLPTQPWGVAVDGSGNVYVADYGNSRGEGDAPGLRFLQLRNNAGRRLQRTLRRCGGRERQRLYRRLQRRICLPGAVFRCPPAAGRPVASPCWAAASTLLGAWRWTEAAMSTLLIRPTTR